MDVVALREASGFEFIPLRDDAVNKLLVDEITKASFLASARLARKLFKALLHKLMTGEIRVVDLDLSALEAGGK